jgi:leucyl-tRNA synthetase
VAQAEAQRAALADARIQRYVDGAEIRKVIFVPDKLLNLVIAAR